MLKLIVQLLQLLNTGGGIDNGGDILFVVDCDEVNKLFGMFINMASSLLSMLRTIAIFMLLLLLTWREANDEEGGDVSNRFSSTIWNVGGLFIWWLEIGGLLIVLEITLEIDRFFDAVNILA